VALARSSNTAMEHRNRCTDLRHPELLATSLLKCPRQDCCETPSETKKIGKLSPLSSFIFLTLRGKLSSRPVSSLSCFSLSARRAFFRSSACLSLEAGSKVFVIEISFMRTTSVDGRQGRTTARWSYCWRGWLRFEALHRGTSKRRLIQGRIWIGDAVLNQTRVDLGLPFVHETEHPAFYRCRESYPRRNGSPRNCSSRAGDERSAVPVCV
jgi:hypothetical protein